MKTLIIAVAGLVLATSLPAAAQGSRNDARQWRQQERIERGYHSGRLTPREAARLQRQQDRIQRVESRSRYRNGGTLDPRSRQKIERLQDRASRNIDRKNHNRRGW